MRAEDLITALESRGLSVVADRKDGFARLLVRRPEAHARLADTVTVEHGTPYWSWGSPIKPGDDRDENDPAVIAERIDKVVSEDQERFRSAH